MILFDYFFKINETYGEVVMVSGTNFNIACNDSYMVMPLTKTKTEGSTEWSVKGNFEEEINKQINILNMKSMMGNLNDIKRADTNHDNIISLNELRACDNKSEFMEHLIFELEQFEKTWKVSNHH